MGNVAVKTELPRYVGYAEIAEATGIDKRQLQRLMALGKFPKPDGLKRPVQLSPGAVDL